MALEISKEEKNRNQLASEYRVHPNVLYRWKKQALENPPKLFKDENKGKRDRQTELERQVNERYREIGRLTTQLNWLKKQATMSGAKRIAMPETHSSAVSLKDQSRIAAFEPFQPVFSPAATFVGGGSHQTPHQ